MGRSAHLQKLCAVYEADKVAENERDVFPKFPCYKDECPVIAEICVGGIIKVTGDCEAFDQDGVFDSKFQESSSENI